MNVLYLVLLLLLLHVPVLAQEPWHICPRGSRAMGESFVFTSRPLEDMSSANNVSSSMHFYHASGNPDSVLFWADAEMFAISNALVLRDDFKCGSSAPCPSFASPALTADGLDFDVCDFECWGFRGDDDITHNMLRQYSDNI